MAEAPVGQIVLMGVAGSGKSTIGAMLAERLGCEMAEADDFHSPANVAKMKMGIPLQDAERWPWLRDIAAWIAERDKGGRTAVVTCSALKRVYRDVLRSARDFGRSSVSVSLAVATLASLMIPPYLSRMQICDSLPPRSIATCSMTGLLLVRLERVNG